jgi:hypothetical protein
MPPKFRLGKKPPRLDKRTLKFGKYLTAALPSPPATVTYYTAVSTWPMMGNDTYGDCTCAAAGHLVEQWTQQADGTPEIIPDADILAAYNVVDGGVDQGADMLTVLQYWQNTGIPTTTTPDKIGAYASVTVSNQTEVQDAVAIFGGCYIGLALPDYAVNPPDGNLLDVDWTAVPAGGFAANPPDPDNGHCVPIVGYDANNVYVITWGTVKAMSWAFFYAYADEAYAILSPDWLSAQGTSIEGFNMAQLQADLAAIGSAPPVVTPPAPTPTPTPTPTPGPTPPITPPASVVSNTAYVKETPTTGGTSSIRIRLRPRTVGPTGGEVVVTATTNLPDGTTLNVLVNGVQSGTATVSEGVALFAVTIPASTAQSTVDIPVVVTN